MKTYGISNSNSKNKTSHKKERNKNRRKKSIKMSLKLQLVENLHGNGVSTIERICRRMKENSGQTEESKNHVMCDTSRIFITCWDGI
jgi:hypothetical protein